MDRRRFVSGGAAMALLARVAARGAPITIDPDDLRTAAREAWLYGLPLIEAARLRTAAIGDKPDAGKAGFNSFLHQRDPAGPGQRDFSAPEADVLYSSAWIHLGGGPARISVPPTGGRYFSLAVFDFYGNVLVSVEGHEAAKNGHEISVIGPPSRVGVAGYTAPLPRMPPLHKMIKARGLWVWALARTHLEGDHDLPAAHQLQDGLQVRVNPAKKPPQPAQPVARDAAWNDYFYAVQQLIDENPPPSDDEGFFRRVAPLQVGMYGGFEKARFADADLEQIAKGAAEGATLASQAPQSDPRSDPQSDRLGGWAYPRDDIGDYGQDFLYRAQMALTETAALRPQLVTALHAVGPAGRRGFPGGKPHRLLLPLPPASGFWSLTLYEAQPDGRLFLAENPRGRYAISGWTPGLRRRDDGSIDIVVSRTDPDHGANWLPAPADGPFALVLRAYAPGDGVLQRRYRPPPLEAL
jgi:hypothetical protein